MSIFLVKPYVKKLSRTLRKIHIAGAIPARFISFWTRTEPDDTRVNRKDSEREDTRGDRRHARRQKTRAEVEY